MKQSLDGKPSSSTPVSRQGFAGKSLRSISPFKCSGSAYACAGNIPPFRGMISVCSTYIKILGGGGFFRPANVFYIIF
jgi:hypothetical protein